MIQQKSKYQQYVDQAVSDLIVYGDSDAIWTKIRIRGRDELRMQSQFIRDVRDAYLVAQDERERNTLLRQIKVAQQKAGL
jgi:hypothetical protein